MFFEKPYSIFCCTVFYLTGIIYFAWSLSDCSAEGIILAVVLSVRFLPLDIG